MKKQNQKYFWLASASILLLVVVVGILFSKNFSMGGKLQGNAASVSPLAGHILNPACNASITTGAPGTTVTFSVAPIDPSFFGSYSASSGYSVGYFWSGDGGLYNSNLNDPSLNWTYASAGTYKTTVDLQLLFQNTGLAGGTIVENHATVNCPAVTIAVPAATTPPPPLPILTLPTLSCSGNPGVVFPGDTITWTATMSPSVSGTTFSWSLPVTGTGQTVTSIAPSSAGSLPMSVTYTIPGGLFPTTSTASCSITVHGPTSIIHHGFAPIMSSIYPTSGPIAGGTLVQITGQYFDPTATANVTFDGIPATNVTVNSATLITAVTPGDSNAGTVDVNFIDSNGKQATLPGAFTYSAPTPAPVSAPPPAPKPAPAPPPITFPAPTQISTDCSMFRDVNPKDPDCAAIGYVNSIGAMTGNPNGTFDPNALLQRDQIAKIILVAFKLYNGNTDYCGGGTSFPDISSDNWSFEYICAAKAIGLVTGYQTAPDAGYYRPSRNVSRIEFLAILLRSLGDTIPSTNSTSYSDVPLGQWYSGYASYSLNHGLFSGPNLYPTNSTTRREVARILYQLYKEGII